MCVSSYWSACDLIEAVSVISTHDLIEAVFVGLINHVSNVTLLNQVQPEYVTLKAVSVGECIECNLIETVAVGVCLSLKS